VLGKTGGVDRRVHGDRFFVAAEELPRIGHARHHLHYFHRRPDVRSRHQTRSTRAQEQIKADKFQQRVTTWCAHGCISHTGSAAANGRCC